MITTVSLNPSIDKMVAIDSFNYGGMNRVLKSRMDVSGKGINTAVAYTQLSGQALCTGINYRVRGDMVTEFLNEKQVEYDFVTVDGEVRINHKILDISKNIVTELNESGNPVVQRDLDILKKKVIRHCKKSSTLVLNGSVPKGVSTATYKDLLESVSQLPLKTILDAEGSLLLEGIKGRPYIIKPNLYELETALDIKITSHREIIKAAHLFIKKGARIVCVSLGKEGALIVDENHAFHGSGVRVDVKGTVGAGDSMVAGLCLAIDEGLNLAGMLSYGIAAATATIMREGTLMCTREDFRAILPRVEVVSL